MNAKDIKNEISEEAHKALENIKKLENFSEREIKDTYLASEILLELTKGHEVSPEQIMFLKEQSVNLGKALALIGLQAVPGSSVAIVLLEKVTEKHGFSLFPKVIDEPEMPEDKN